MLGADVTQMSHVSNSTNSELAHNHSPAFYEFLGLWKVKLGFYEVPYICIRNDYRTLLFRIQTSQRPKRATQSTQNALRWL